MKLLFVRASYLFGQLHHSHFFIHVHLCVITCRTSLISAAGGGQPRRWVQGTREQSERTSSPNHHGPVRMFPADHKGVLPYIQTNRWRVHVKGCGGSVEYSCFFFFCSLHSDIHSLCCVTVCILCRQQGRCATQRGTDGCVGMKPKLASQQSRAVQTTLQILTLMVNFSALLDFCLFSNKHFGHFTSLK